MRTFTRLWEQGRCCIRLGSSLGHVTTLGLRSHMLVLLHIASQSHDFMLYLQYGSSQSAKATAEGENKLRNLYVL